MTGVNCSDYPISLYDEDAEVIQLNDVHTPQSKYSVQTSCVS